MTAPEFVLTLSCPDRRGIVAAVSGLLAGHGCNILESRQYLDRYADRFFLRMHVAAESTGTAGAGAGADPGARGARGDELRGALAALAPEFGMDWRLFEHPARTRVLVLVSRAGHCLNDLLYRRHSGQLPIDVVAVASNHPDLAGLAHPYAIPYHHLPVTPATRAGQEAALLDLVQRYAAELVVLARYMQVLSPDLCAKLAGRVINIHHSFLPSFAGARPYHQAHARGVKLIGATAHYVTSDLDEGPIIEQEVARVDHAHGPADLAAVGRDLECLALARAVRWHVEHRVLLNGGRTVVFR